MFKSIIGALFVVSFSFSYLAAEHVLSFKAKTNKPKGKQILLIAGDEEYRSEESMPMIAKILSQYHGFDCKVIFSWDPSKKYIDPNNQAGLIGLEHLKDSDLVIIGTRFRRLDETQISHMTSYLNSGKPVIGIRTSTHAFTGKGSFGDKIGVGSFGLKILGEKWVSHHGKHKKQGARGVIENENKSHAILHSVKDVFAPSDVYGVIHLTDADQILMRGAVTESLDPKSKFVDEKNNPMMPFAWLHRYEAPNGVKGTSFCTTAGASVDLVSEDLRRMIVNAAHFLLKFEVPEKAKVDYVDPFYPSFYGFIRDKDYWPGQQKNISHYQLGKSTVMPDPKGTPEWNFRPMKK